MLDCLYIVMSEVTSSGLEQLADLQDGAGIVEMAEDRAGWMRKIYESSLSKVLVRRPKGQVERVSTTYEMSARYTFLLHQVLSMSVRHLFSASR